MLSLNSWATALADIGKTGAGHVSKFPSNLDASFLLHFFDSSILETIGSSALATPEISVPLQMWFLLTLLWTFSCMASLSTSPQYFIRQDLPISIPDFDIPGNAGYHSLRDISSLISVKFRLLTLAASDLWIFRLVHFAYRCFGSILLGDFLSYLNIFTWIKCIGIVIRASMPDYLFSDFVLLGIVTYGSHQVAEVSDSGKNCEGELDLDLLHIPMEDWLDRAKPRWARLRSLLEMRYEDLAYYGGEYAFYRGHDDYEVQNLTRTRPQPVIRPGHSIYKPPHLQTTPTAEHRLERTQTQDESLDKFGIEAVQDQSTEAEQEEEQAYKRRTRRGGRKYHERKLRNLEKMAAVGDSEYGTDETVVPSFESW
ncbi:unnamed protein product [Rhizoctonia solani]|uniref:Uncharacterized protein n=1 Tax=Rhizoctonia solani TaxID=456999 RepID=A0A8H3B3T6_9AGAM|nr:unnamed protein product [Rhizoctonia solani]